MAYSQASAFRTLARLTIHTHSLPYNNIFHFGLTFRQHALFYLSTRESTLRRPHYALFAASFGMCFLDIHMRHDASQLQPRRHTNTPLQEDKRFGFQDSTYYDLARMPARYHRPPVLRAITGFSQATMPAQHYLIAWLSRFGPLYGTPHFVPLFAAIKFTIRYSRLTVPLSSLCYWVLFS